MWIFVLKISSLNAPISANKVSMFKLTIEEQFKDYFRLIQAKSLTPAIIKSVTFFLGHPVGHFCKITYFLFRHLGQRET